MVEIELVDQVNGYLDVDENFSVPLNFKIGDIRDPFSRAGKFSKTIHLLGTKNNNILLNSYFDVNIVDGTFNVNEVHRCNVYQDNEILVEDGIIRLLKVVKKSDKITKDDVVSYEVQVIDTIGDFFKETNNKELEDLVGFSQYDRTLTVSNVFNNWDGNPNRGFVFALRFAQRNSYHIGEFLPAMFVKTYWDMIHEQNGFEYEFKSFIPNFDRLIIPFNGDLAKVLERVNDSMESIIRKTNTIDLANYTQSTIPEQDPVKINFTSKEKDGENLFSLTTSYYTVPTRLIGDTKVNINLEMDLDLGLWIESVVSGVHRMKIDIADENRYLRIIPTITVYREGAVVPANFITEAPVFVKWLSPDAASQQNFRITDSGELQFYTQTLATPLYTSLIGRTETNPLPVIDSKVTATAVVQDIPQNTRIQLAFGLKIIEERGSFPDIPIRLVNIDSAPPSQTIDVGVRLVASNIRTTFRLADNSSLPEGWNISIREFIHKGIKQSDFLKSIYGMFNLFPIVNKDNNKIEYYTRDDYYEMGNVKDWTKKLDRSKEVEIYFLPEITEREVTLTYSTDTNDEYAQRYKNIYGKEFGEKTITYDNRNAVGEKRQEVIFAPTLNVENNFEMNIPYYRNEGGLRIMHYLGTMAMGAGRYWLINDTRYTVYPLFSFFNAVTNPTYSLEFGKSDSYAYDVGIPPVNNLFQLFWDKTYRRINKGRMIVGYFYLTPSDISSLELNDVIIIDDNKYLINSIKDYNATKSTPTKVELLTLEEDFESRGEVIEPFI